jgi:hypothetical protein
MDGGVCRWHGDVLLDATATSGAMQRRHALGHVVGHQSTVYSIWKSRTSPAWLHISRHALARSCAKEGETASEYISVELPLLLGAVATHTALRCSAETL